MHSLTVEAAAKINLSLDVVGKRPDGYHLLSTVMQSISLSDRVYLEFDKQGTGLIILSDQPNIPLNERNTAHKAARSFLEATGITAGVRIFLEKRIPDAAGLAGGSSDAAAVLHGSLSSAAIRLTRHNCMRSRRRSVLTCHSVARAEPCFVKASVRFFHL